MGSVLVTGGAGYIGSHIVRRLRADGRDVVVLDDLTEGHRAALGDTRVIEADFGDRLVLDELLDRSRVDWVIHMAAHCQVGESVLAPGKYYANNLVRSLTLLEAVARHSVRGIVFSSTAAVYGEPREVPIGEDHPLAPTNPYGETKLAFERALHWFHGAHQTRSVSLRYFNAAGAHPDMDLGEDHEPESHLIPNLLRGALAGKDAAPVPIFGSDYPTKDGTCVRDYVHVCDLADAHVAALSLLEAGAVTTQAYNLGNGEGFSVLDVVDAVARIAGARPKTVAAPRRAGDPATLVASSAKARAALGWTPRFPTIDAIVRTAWDWHRKHPDGYGDRPLRGN